MFKEPCSNKSAILLRFTLIFLTAAILIAAVILFSALFRFDQKMKTEGKLYPVEILGEYSEEGGPWKTLTHQTDFENKDLRDITVRGHFSRDIPEGDKLFLNIDHMRVALRINGEEIYSTGPVRSGGNPTQAVGKQWVTIVSPGITVSDKVELNFGNLYWNAYMIQFDELLRQMHTGDERMMLFKAVSNDGWTMTIGTIFLFLTLFLLIVALECTILRIDGARRFLWLGLITLFSSIWFYTLSPAPTLILPFPVFLNVMYSCSMQGIAVFVVLFAAEHLTGWRKKSLLYCTGLLLLVTLAAMVNQIFMIQDLYSAINYFSILELLVALWVIYCLAYETRRLHNRESAQLLKAILPLAVCAVVELINGYVQFLEAAILLGLGLISFSLIEEIYTIRRIKRSMNSEKRALILENELNQNRISVMLSQVQPHFLFNALQGIKQLCDTEPVQASEALEHFSFYLRGNLDSLIDKQLISFERELFHVNNYLYLEKMRFPKKLNIEIEILYQDFLLPPLTVQTIVENAVRHGIIKKKAGGTVRIKSERTDENIIVTIRDDGLGFEPDIPKEDGRTHVGIENVRNRLMLQCGGSLEIESEVGVGTTVKIILPQKEELKGS